MVSSLLLCWQARLTGCMPHACYVATCSRAFLLCALFKLLVGLVHKSFFTAALGPQFSIAAPGILNSTRPGRSAHTTEQEACTISAWRCTSASGRRVWRMQDIEAQDQKSCDTDEGGCGERNSIQHLLDGAPPRVFTMQLAWESHCESADAIRDTLSAVQEVPPEPPT